MFGPLDAVVVDFESAVWNLNPTNKSFLSPSGNATLGKSTCSGSSSDSSPRPIRRLFIFVRILFLCACFCGTSPLLTCSGVLFFDAVEPLSSISMVVIVAGIVGLVMILNSFCLTGIGLLSTLSDWLADSRISMVLVANFFKRSSSGIDGTCSSVVNGVSFRPYGRLYGVFGLSNARFVFSNSLVIFKSIGARLPDNDVSAMVGSAFETRRSSVSGVLYLLITSRIRLAVLDMDVVPFNEFSDDVDFEVTKLVGILAR